MSKHPLHDFGIVDEKGDAFEFHYGTGQAAECRLETVNQTERGTKRTEMAAISTVLWRKVSKRAVRELSIGMGEEERTRKAPTIKIGSNRLGPLIGRELAVLLYALMEEGSETRVEDLLHGWRELAREERWWLFAKSTAPGQHAGVGWRRALFYGLSKPNDSCPSMDSVLKIKPKQYTVSTKKTVVQQEQKLCGNEEESDKTEKNTNQVELPDQCKTKRQMEYGVDGSRMIANRNDVRNEEKNIENEYTQTELF